MPGPIGLIVRAVKKAKQRREERKRGDEPTPHVTAAPVDATKNISGGAAVVPAAAAQGAAQTVSSKDEEDGGKAPVPDGEPTDPQNAQSKRWSYRAMLILGFALAIDYTMSMMSIQAFYYAMQGPQRLYGLTFGAYDLTGMLMAPLFGAWSDKNGKFKAQFLSGGWINVAGNLIYAFTFLSGKWWMMLLARLVAGIGEATLGLGSSYIAATTTLEARQVALMKYRVSQSMGRMFGPFIGYIFLGLPEVNGTSSTALKVFNWYTIPGWVAAVMVALITAVFWHVFINPTYENEHLIQHPETKKKDVDPARAARFHTYVIIWLILVAVTSFIQFAYYSNMFAVFAGQYHAINTQTDQWKVFVGVGVGAAVGGLTYRRGIRWFPTVFNERVLTLAGAWGMFVVLMLVIPYHGSTAVPSEVTFYASSGIFGATVVIGSSAIETVFSKKVTQYQDVAGKNIGKLLGAFYMATAAGRFAGPLVAGAVTQIATPSGDVFYCPNGWTSVDANGDPTCKNAAGQPLPGSCAITSDYYYVSGCVLWHAIPFYAALAGVQVVLCLALHFMLWKHWHYTD